MSPSTLFARAAVPAALSLALAAPAAFAQAPAAPPPPPNVKVGQPAPAFTLPYLAAKPDGGFERRQMSLADFRGRQNVVIAFFPGAFSPG